MELIPKNEPLLIESIQKAIQRAHTHTWGVSWSAHHNTLSQKSSCMNITFFTLFFFFSSKQPLA